LYKQRLLVSVIVILLLTLTSCNASAPTSAPDTSVPTATTNPVTTANAISTISFTLSGGVTGSYTLKSSPPLSKLRHGHKEFTIDLATTGQSIFLVFYGYNGPGSYTLTNGINGGDVRIDLGSGLGAWDLALQTHASCSLTIVSDTPTQDEGLDTMTGSFSCPHLPPSNPDHTKQPITVTNGQFTIIIIVES